VGGREKNRRRGIAVWQDGHEKAAMTAVFLHGMAGDIAAEELGFESVIASDLVKKTGEAFRRIKA
jgi:NAD(P)H-hydrate repair Nnr-like enzyme with NAD(P)H-hydrate dehydratase domain